MQNEESLTPAERELEAALQGLLPAGPAIDRDRLMFLAGQRSARRRQHAWQGVAAVFAVALAASMAVRPAPKPSDRFVALTGGSAGSGPSDVSPTAERSPAARVQDDEAEYVRLRDKVLVRGVEAMPTETIWSAAMTAPSPGSERLLDTSPQRRQRWGFFGLEKLISVGDQI